MRRRARRRLGGASNDDLFHHEPGLREQVGVVVREAVDGSVGPARILLSNRPSEGWNGRVPPGEAGPLVGVSEGWAYTPMFDIDVKETEAPFTNEILLEWGRLIVATLLEFYPKCRWTPGIPFLVCSKPESQAPTRGSSAATALPPSTRLRGTCFAA